MSGWSLPRGVGTTSCTLYAEKKFVGLCHLNAFDGIELKAMEKFVSFGCLMVRSEVDVVRAIVSWPKSRSENQKESINFRSGNTERR